MAAFSIAGALLYLCFPLNTIAFGINFWGTLSQGHDKRQISAQICPQAAPGVDGSMIFATACAQNPQNDEASCLDRLWDYANSSILATCQHFYNQYRSCQAIPKSGQADCENQHELWNSCADYTLQAYAYCGCFYNLPNDISNCANIELGIQEQAEIQSSQGLPSEVSFATTTTGDPDLGPTAPEISTGKTGADSGQSLGQPTMAAIGPTFTPSFVPTGTLASVPEIPFGTASTVATFTLQLPSVTSLVSNCTTGTSIYRCTETSTLYSEGMSPWITGFICQGGACQNQQAGYEYCERITQSIIALVTPT